MNAHRIDVQHHIFPPEYVSMLKEIGITESYGQPIPNWTPDKSLVFMKKMGIATAIGSVSTPGVYFKNDEFSRDLARLCNEYFAGLKKEYPGKFGGFASLPLPFAQGALEAVWATNHLGPSLLTKLLLDAIKNSEQGRIITIASKGLKAKPFLKVDLEDPEFRKKKFSIIDAYYQSKRAQVMYTYWLAEELKDTSITANCIQVPAVQVDISKYSKLPSIMRFLYSLKSKFALSPEEMAETYTYLTTSDEMRSVTGKYFDEKRRIVKSNKYTYQTENIEKIMILTMSYLKQDRGSK